MAVTEYKTFNGVKFYIDAASWLGLSKADATKIRDDWKKTGHKARIVKNEQGKYVVYRETPLKLSKSGRVRWSDITKKI
jgi:hypothetical protein